MTAESTPESDAIGDALQAISETDRPAVLTGWVVLTEWMDDEGERWLVFRRSSTTTAWACSGMLHEALHSEWGPGDD